MGRVSRFSPNFARLMTAIFAGSLLAGCAGTPHPHAALRAAPKLSSSQEIGGQCAPFVREHSRVRLFGDASTWWDKAKGRYARRDYPTLGAVMVLYQYAGPSRAHVAVVRKIDGDSVIRVDHANWLNDGKIYRNDPVRDAEQSGSWRYVNVFNMETGRWGLRRYAVQGFIGPDAATDDVPISSVSDWLRYARFAPLQSPAADDRDW